MWAGGNHMITNTNETRMIGWGHDADTLTTCLKAALSLKGCQYLPFKHFAPVPGLDYSVRIYGINPFDSSVEFPKPLTAEKLAHELLRLGKSGARYPEHHSSTAVKGWMIHSMIDGEGNLLVAAYASWGNR